MLRSVVTLPPANPDIQGYAIRFSSFTAHLCVALLIAYSTKTQRRFYLPLLSQVALTILAVWLCRGSNQLSLSDIEFAIVQTQSPVSVYILLLVVPRLFFQRPALTKQDAPSKSHNERSFFRGMLSSENIDWALIQHRVWGLLYALCCLSLNLVRQFDKAGYSGVTQTDRSPRPGKVWLGLAVCSVYGCVLHRHRELRRKIMHQLAGKRKKSLKAWPLRKRLRWGFVSTWFIATKLHPWLPFSYAALMFLNWSWDMNIWSIEDDFRWTFGQLLAMCQTTVTLYPCWQLCYSSWREVLPLPRRLILDAIWLISGKGQPWTECDLILKDLWDAFPPDITPEEIGLPTAITVPPLSVTDLFPTSVRSRRRKSQNRTNWGVGLEHNSVSLLEEDIADHMSNRR